MSLPCRPPGGNTPARTNGHTSAPPDAFDLVVSQLEQRGRVKRSGGGVIAQCPGHDDRTASLTLKQGDTRAVVAHCFAGCRSEDIIRALGLDPAVILAARADGSTSSAGGTSMPRIGPSGITVSALAREKGIPERELRAFGLQDAIGRRAVEIPYPDQNGATLLTRTRTLVRGKSKTLQPAGSDLVPYGLDRIDAWKAAETPLIVEGESDCWTLWHHGMAALGLPGASSAGCLELEHVEGVPRLNVHQEPDAGGAAFWAGVREQLAAIGWEGDLYAFGLWHDGKRVKDPNALHLAVGGDRAAFSAALAESIASAVLVGDDGDGLPVWETDDDPSERPDAQQRLVELEARVKSLEKQVTERDETIEKLREEIHEYKVGEQLVRNGPFTPDGALVVKHLVTVATAAIANGKEFQPLERSEVARLALGAKIKVIVKPDGTEQRVVDPSAERAVSRALRAYKAYQDDPELAATLPYRLKWEERGRKTHIDLYPLKMDTPRSKAEEYLTLARLPQDRKPAPKVMERDDSCRRCNSPEGVEVRGTRRCLNEKCGHTWHTKAVIVGRRDPEQPVPTLVTPLPGQNVPDELTTYAGQNVPATPTGPRARISFTDPRGVIGFIDPPAHLHLVESTPKVSQPVHWRCSCGSYERIPKHPAPDERFQCDGCGLRFGVTAPALSSGAAS